jgi:hypothetical protein
MGWLFVEGDFGARKRVVFVALEQEVLNERIRVSG